jgi:hypothetical protein
VKGQPNAQVVAHKNRRFAERQANQTGQNNMEADFCTNDGARRIKMKIEEYWKERGYDVEVKLVDAGFVAAMRSARTDVRSDMVNGFPRRRSDSETTSRGLMDVA